MCCVRFRSKTICAVFYVTLTLCYKTLVYTVDFMNNSGSETGGVQILKP